MNMIGDKRPGITAGGGFLKDSPETNEEVLVILRTLKDRVPVYPSYNDMVKTPGPSMRAFLGMGSMA